MQMMSFCKSTNWNGSFLKLVVKVLHGSAVNLLCSCSFLWNEVAFSFCDVDKGVWIVHTFSQTFILEAGCCVLIPEINIFFSVGERTAREALVCINHFPCSRLQSSCCINLHVNEEGGRLLRLILHGSFTWLKPPMLCRTSSAIEKLLVFVNRWFVYSAAVCWREWPVGGAADAQQQFDPNLQQILGVSRAAALTVESWCGCKHWVMTEHRDEPWCVCLCTVTHSVRRLSAVCESCGSVSMTASYEQIYISRKSRCLSIVVNEGEAFRGCGENTPVDSGRAAILHPFMKSNLCPMNPTPPPVRWLFCRINNLSVHNEPECSESI